MSSGRNWDKERTRRREQKNGIAWASNDSASPPSGEHNIRKNGPKRDVAVQKTGKPRIVVQPSEAKPALATTATTAKTGKRNNKLNGKTAFNQEKSRSLRERPVTSIFEATHSDWKKSGRLPLDGEVLKVQVVRLWAAIRDSRLQGASEIAALIQEECAFQAWLLIAEKKQPPIVPIL